MSRNTNAKAKVRGPRQNLRNRNGNARRSDGSIPQIRSNIVKRHRFRFIAASAQEAAGISTVSILGALGVKGVTATTVSRFNRSFKLQSMDIWAPTSDLGTPVTASVEWLGLNTPNIEQSDTSVNPSQPAHLRCSPPGSSIAAFWQTADNDINLFNLSCPGGSVIDIVVMYIELDQPAVELAVTVIAATPGVNYYLALDGPGVNTLIPVSLNTTQ
jgi:hypothetical protein